MNLGPYRTPAEMPEKKNMTLREMENQVARKLLANADWRSSPKDPQAIYSLDGNFHMRAVGTAVDAKVYGYFKCANERSQDQFYVIRCSWFIQRKFKRHYYNMKKKIRKHQEEVLKKAAEVEQTTRLQKFLGL